METFVFGFGGLPLETRVCILRRMESFVFVVLAASPLDRADKPVSVYCGGWNRLCLWFWRLHRWTEQTNPCLYTVADGIVCVCGFGGFTDGQSRQTRVCILWRMESFVFVVLAVYRWRDQTNPYLYTVAGRRVMSWVCKTRQDFRVKQHY